MNDTSLKKPSKLQMFWRALLVGVIMAAISVVVGWLSARNAFYNNNYFPRMNNEYLRAVISALETYRTDHLTYPATLEQAYPTYEDIWSDSDKVRPLESFRRDYYGTPLAYEANETTYTLITYARDEKPGGAGYDADWIYVNSDLVSEHPIILHDNQSASFTYYWTRQLGYGPHLLALLVGTLATILFYKAQRSHRVPRAKPSSSLFSREAIVSFMIVLAVSVIITWILAATHVPNNH